MYIIGINFSKRVKKMNKEMMIKQIAWKNLECRVGKIRNHVVKINLLIYQNISRKEKLKILLKIIETQTNNLKNTTILKKQ